MSSIGSPSPFFFGGATSYEIERSLRFVRNDNAYLSRTPSSAGNRKTWTYSAWVKLGQTGINSSTDPGNGLFLSCGAGSTAANMALRITNNGYIGIDYYGVGGFYSTGRLKDPSAWYHCVWVMDTTESTAANRMKVYVNGTLFYNNSMSLSQNADTPINNNSLTTIGVYPYNTSHAYRLDGCLAEVNFIDGQALDSSYFGKTSTTTGQWIPKKYTGTYGNNGFYLKFDDNTNNAALGADSSGNSNNWTPSNIASSHDTLSDTPTNNFCVLNPLNKTNDADLREGNLKFFQSSNDESATATFGITSGKWYWEVYKNSSQNPELGIEPLTEFLSNKTDVHSSTKVGFRTNGGDQQVGTGSPTSITGSSGGQTGAGVIAIAVDFDNKKIWYSDTSGNFFNSGNPATGLNAAFTFSNVAVANGCVPHFFCGTGSNNSFHVNFGQDGTFGGNTSAGGYADGNGHGNFKYSVPSGYLALCSANLSDPTIQKPTDYFDTALWTGDGSSGQQITGLNFQPDLAWVKCRSNSKFHILVDLVRGNSNNLSSNSDTAEYTETHITSFNSDGFTVADIDSGTANENGFTYVGWAWNAGGSTATNNDGTISAQVRASTTAGFSIVSYTGNGSNSQTVGHGLGVTPDLVILKDRDTNGITGRWTVLHSYDTSKNLELNTENAAFGHQGRGSVTGVSNSTFTLFGSTDTQTVNESGDDYIAYVFSGVSGYSKFGTYTGNGSTNGPFIFTGFKPAFVIIRSTGSGKWTIFDNKRNPENPVNKRLKAESSAGEDASYRIFSFLANGMKLEDQYDGEWNSNGTTFIYIAFAESPFKYANAR